MQALQRLLDCPLGQIDAGDPQPEPPQGKRELPDVAADLEHVHALLEAPEPLFNWLTGRLPETFAIGTVPTARVPFTQYQSHAPSLPLKTPEVPFECTMISSKQAA